MTKLRRLILVTVLALGVLAFGVCGFMIIEGWNFLDALYMAVITATTVGYGETRPLNEAGRIFNLVFILLGVGMIFSILGTIWQVMLEGRIQSLLGRRRLEKEIRKLQEHYVVCGFGRVGSLICREIQEEGRPLLVIEERESLIPRIEEMRIPYIQGNATEEKILRQAGIERARGLVSCLSTDADNLYVCLTAREIRPDLFIITLSSDPTASKRLLRAGASRVISPHYMGARKMAQELLRPGITDFIEIMFQEKTMELTLEEIPVGPNSKLHNVMLKDSGIRQDYNLIVVGIRKKTGEMLYNPTFDALIEKGDTLIALGLRANLRALAKKLGAE